MSEMLFQSTLLKQVQIILSGIQKSDFTPLENELYYILCIIYKILKTYTIITRLNVNSIYLK